MRTLSLPKIITNMGTKISPYSPAETTIIMDSNVYTIRDMMIQVSSNTKDGIIYTGFFCKHKTYKTVALQC